MKKIVKGFEKFKKKISTSKNFFRDNTAQIKEIISTLQSDNYIITEEQYNKEFAPLDKYYKKEQFNKNPILFIAVVSFNQKQGSIIEFTYPDKNELLKNEDTITFLTSLIDENNKKINTIEKVIENIKDQLTYLCIPDGAHSLSSDSQFFLIQNFSKILFGISCYRQLQVTQAMKEDEQENTRECVQKAMCIVSKLPLFGQMASKLSMTMLAYFNQDSLKDKKIIQDLYSNYPNNYLSRIQVSEILESFSIKRLIYFMKTKIFVLIKLILLEKKVLVYSHISNNVCSFIFSFLSLFPGGAFFSLDNQGKTNAYYNCYTPYGLPLKFLNSNSVLYSIMTLYDLEEIEKSNITSYFIGTTNPLFLDHKKINFDCIINLDKTDSTRIFLNKNIPHPILRKGILENNIIDQIYEHCKMLFNRNTSNNIDDNWMLDSENNRINSFDDKAEKISKTLDEIEDNIKFEGSDDYLRGIFKNYFTNFLADISLVKKIIKTENDDQEKFSGVKEILKDYNCDFILKWITTTKNFMYWNYEHSPELWRFSIHLKKCKNVIKHYENGNIYDGELGYGEPNNKGKLNYIFHEIPYTYQGEFLNGKKNGKGILYSQDNKYNYDGDWKDDQFEGYGTLFDHKEKYTGEFKNNLYNGKGTLFLPNGYILQGSFKNGKAFGKGEMSKEGGDNYNGDFKNGLFHGRGVIKYKDGGIYNGCFFEGKKKGYGKYEYNNGDVYEGYFVDDIYNGEGILNKKDGEILKGVFKDGELVEKIDNLILEKDDMFDWENIANGEENQKGNNLNKINISKSVDLTHNNKMKGDDN